MFSGVAGRTRITPDGENFWRWSAVVWLDVSAVFILQRSGRRLTFKVWASPCLDLISPQTKHTHTHTHTHTHIHLLQVVCGDEWMSEDFTGSDALIRIHFQDGLQELDTLLSLSLSSASALPQSDLPSVKSSSWSLIDNPGHNEGYFTRNSLRSSWNRDLWPSSTLSKLLQLRLIGELNVLSSFAEGSYLVWPQTTCWLE